MRSNTVPGDWLTLPPRYRIRAARRLAARTKTQLSPALHVIAARNDAQRVQRGTWLLCALCAALAGLGAAAGWW